jgi:hypothetical protein
MDSLDECIVWQDEALISDFLVPTDQTIVVYELVGEEHNICIHAILLCELDHRMGVSF